MNGISILLAALLALMLPILVNEFSEAAPWLAQRLTNFAASRLPKPFRARYREEWLAELEAHPGRILKLVFSIRTVLAVGFLSRTLQGESPHIWSWLRIGKRSGPWLRQVRAGWLLIALGLISGILSGPLSNSSRWLSVALVIQGSLLMLLGFELRRREDRETPQLSAETGKLAWIDRSVAYSTTSIDEKDHIAESIEREVIGSETDIERILERRDAAGLRQMVARLESLGDREGANNVSVLLGRVLGEEGDYDGARAAYELGINSQHAWIRAAAYDGLGDLFAKQGQVERAQEAYERAIDLGDDFWTAAANVDLGQLLQEQGDFPAARAAYERALGSSHIVVETIANDFLGDLLVELDDFEGARAAYQRAISAGDKRWSAIASCDLGSLLEKQGDLVGARTAYEQAMRSDDVTAVARSAKYLGDLLAKQEDSEGARAAYQRSIDAGEKFWSYAAAVDLGRLLSRRGDHYSAEVLYKNVMDAEDDYWSSVAADLLGDLLAAQGDPDGAQGAYWRAIESGDPYWRATAAIDLGRLLARQGDLEGARAAYQQAIESSESELASRATIERAALDLSDVDQRVLERLSDSIGLDIAQVASSALITPGEAEEALRHLVEAGQVSVLSEPDGRRRFLKVARSPAGQAST